MLQLLKLFVASNRGTSVSAHFPPNYKNVMKQILMGLAALQMSLCVFAQTSENTVIADTLSQGVTLAEVEIKGSTMIDKSDRKLLIPTQEQAVLSANGMDLLRNMQIPQISVDLANGEIKTVDSGTLSVRINGREATVDDVKALDPATVKRVEYHETPSMRYGEVDAVVDFIVDNPQRGGYFGADVVQGLCGFGNYFTTAKFNKGRHQFAVTGSYSLRSGFNMWRDNEEYFMMDDGTRIDRTEKGVPVVGAMSNGNAKFNYSYSEPDRLMLYAGLSLWGTPATDNNYQGILTDSETGEQLSVIDQTKKEQLLPSFNFYGQYDFDSSQSVMLDIVATGAYQHSERTYRTGEVSTRADLVNYLTTIDSRNYSLIVNGNYEKRWAVGRLTGGVRYQQAWGENKYLESSALERSREMKSLYYAEWWQPLGDHFDYTLGVSGKQRIYRLEGADDTHTFDLIASLKMRWKINAGNTLRLNLSTSTNTPSATDLSSVEQRIDEYQVFRGNPQLKPYRNFKGLWSYELRRGIFYGKLWASYDYNRNPIMSDKYWVEESGERFLLNTVNNQVSMQTANTAVTVKLDVVPSWFSVSGTFGWNFQRSEGHRYLHRFNSPIASWSAMLTHWNFVLSYEGEINRKSLWGETVSGRENYQVVLLNYRYKDWQFGIGMFNPFMKNYNVPSEDLNRYAGYSRKMHVDMTESLAIVRIAYSLPWGHQAKEQKKRLNNSYDGDAVNAVGK